MTCTHPDWARIATYDGYARVERCDECQEITHRDDTTRRREFVHCDWCTRVITGLYCMDEAETNLALEFGDEPRKFCSGDCLRSAVRWAVRHRSHEPLTIAQLAGDH